MFKAVTSFLPLPTPSCVPRLCTLPLDVYHNTSCFDAYILKGAATGQVCLFQLLIRRMSKLILSGLFFTMRGQQQQMHRQAAGKLQIIG